MSYTIRYSTLIDWKRFQRIPRADQKRIKHAIEEKLTVSPEIFGKPLRQSLFGCRSLRVGEYRVIFKISGRMVDILLFGHRSVVYDTAKKILG